MSALCEHLVHTMKHMFCVKWTRLIVYVPVPASQHFLPPVSNLKTILHYYVQNEVTFRFLTRFGPQYITIRISKTIGRYCSRKYHKLWWNYFFKI